MSEVLVVDDKSEVRDHFRSLLEGEGYTVRTVPNGEKALEAIFVRRPDLVLLDIDMPVLNGFSTCESIRRTDTLLPILFLTGYASEVNELRARTLGADDFFPKDADSSLVLLAIRRALERAATYVKLSRPKPPAEIKIGHGRFRVDVKRHGVYDNGKEIAHLTKSELDILLLLNTERGRYFNNDEIYSALRGDGYVGDCATIRSHISHLRAKLGAAAIYLSGERTAGYALDIL